MFSKIKYFVNQLPITFYQLFLKFSSQTSLVDYQLASHSIHFLFPVFSFMSCLHQAIVISLFFPLLCLTHTIAIRMRSPAATFYSIHSFSHFLLFLYLVLLAINNEAILINNYILSLTK